MIERWVTAWETLPRRQPALWRTGAGALALVAVGTAVLKRLTALPPAALGAGIGLSLLLLVAFGQPLLWNAGERRLRAFWRVLAFILVSGLLTRVARLAHLMPDARMNPEAFASGDVLLLTIGRLVVTLVAAIVVVRLFDRRPVAHLGIAPTSRFWRDFGFGLFLGLFLMTAIFALEYAAGWLAVEGFEQSQIPGLGFRAVLARVAIAFLCVGIYEELSARGYLLRELAQGITTRAISARAALTLATLVSSALFGLGHAGNPNATLTSTVGVALAGVLLAVPYIVNGNLGTSIGMHMTWNFFQGAVYGFPVSGIDVPGSWIVIHQAGPAAWTGGTFGPEAGLLGVLAYAAGIGLVLLRARLQQGEVRLCEALAEGGPSAEPTAPEGPEPAPATA